MEPPAGSNKRINDDREAAQHNFLLKDFFKKKAETKKLAEFKKQGDVKKKNNLKNTIDEKKKDFVINAKGKIKQ
jgi:hypothetical protein